MKEGRRIDTTLKNAYICSLRQLMKFGLGEGVCINVPIFTTQRTLLIGWIEIANYWWTSCKRLLF